MIKFNDFFLLEDVQSLVLGKYKLITPYEFISVSPFEQVRDNKRYISTITKNNVLRFAELFNLSIKDVFKADKTRGVRKALSTYITLTDNKGKDYCIARKETSNAASGQTLLYSTNPDKVQYFHSIFARVKHKNGTTKDLYMDGTIKYRNAENKLHNDEGPAIVGTKRRKNLNRYYLNGDYIIDPSIIAKIDNKGIVNSLGNDFDL